MKEPKMAKWKYMIGYQYYSQKRWKEAIRYFEETLNIKPDYFIVKYRVSYAYIQLAGIYKKLTKPEFWKALGHIKECHELWENFNDKTREKAYRVYVGKIQRRTRSSSKRIHFRKKHRRSSILLLEISRRQESLFSVHP